MFEAVFKQWFRFGNTKAIKQNSSVNYGSYNDDVIRICNSRELESKRYAKMQCVCVYEGKSINTKICWFPLNNQCKGCRCEATEIHFMWFGIWYAVSVKQFQKSFKFSLIHSYPRGAARGSFFSHTMFFPTRECLRNDLLWFVVVKQFKIMLQRQTV